MVRIIKAQANKILLETIKIQIITICLETRIIVKSKISSIIIWRLTYSVITIMRTNKKINLIILIQIIWIIKTNRMIIYLVNPLEATITITIYSEWRIRINSIIKTVIWTIWTPVECLAMVWIKIINNNNLQITPS